LLDGADVVDENGGVDGLGGSRKAVHAGSTRQAGKAQESTGSAGRQATARKQTIYLAAADRRFMQASAAPAKASTATLFSPASSKIGRKSRAGRAH
jgi:hypothetical protein